MVLLGFHREVQPALSYQTLRAASWAKRTGRCDVQPKCNMCHLNAEATAEQ